MRQESPRLQPWGGSQFTYRIQETENIPCLNDTLGVNLGYGLLVP